MYEIFCSAFKGDLHLFAGFPRLFRFAFTPISLSMQNRFDTFENEYVYYLLYFISTNVHTLVRLQRIGI